MIIDLSVPRPLSHAKTAPIMPTISPFAQIVKPLWEPFVVLFPELAPLLRNLSNNCDHYFQEGRRLEQRRLSAAVPSPPPDRTDSSGKNKAG